MFPFVNSGVNAFHFGFIIDIHSETCDLNLSLNELKKRKNQINLHLKVLFHLML